MFFLCLIPFFALIPYAASAPTSLPLCKRSPSAVTSTGTITGTRTSPAVNRFTIPYAKPPTGSLRFKDPQALPVSTAPYDGSSLKETCAQSAGLTYSVNEDCLYLNLFAPLSGTNVPVMIWIHGGSRSATDPGLDGSVLSQQGGIIVVTLEYRQGVLGWLKNDQLGINGNQGLKDIITALNWIQTNIAAFGGNKSKVTLAGQSTGASLIRTLLATPSADQLFAKAILQSGPFNYGDQSVATGTALGSLYAQEVNCTDLACLQSTPVGQILNAQDATVSAATSPESPSCISAVAAAEPFRPIIDGTLVKGNLFKGNTPLTCKDRSFLLTTAQSDGGPQISAISQSFSADGQPSPIDSSLYSYIVQYLLPPAFRSSRILQSGLYSVDQSQPDGTRDTLTRLGTDYVWTCANQQGAANATLYKAAKAVYLGEFRTGITYPSNTNDSYCADKVCHEDDILLVFGTHVGGTLSARQKAVQAEVMARWLAFIKTGSPNSGSYTRWNPVKTGTNLNMLLIGDKAVTSASATDASTVAQKYQFAQCEQLWGKTVPFDSQMY